MNQWDAFNCYEQEQRLARLLKGQHTSEEQRSKQEEQAKQMLDIAGELRLAEQRRRETQVNIQKHIAEMRDTLPATSPIEIEFHVAWRKLHSSIELVPQYRIGRFRVDFAHPETMTAIELDGHEHHHTRRDRTKDYQRQRDIEEQGWRFVRFTGTEIYADVESCVEVTWKRIQGR